MIRASRRWPPRPRRAQFSSAGRSAPRFAPRTSRAAGPSDFSSRFVTEDGRRRIETQLVGPFWTTSVLAALAAGMTLGADPDRAIEAVGNMRPEPHHLSVYGGATGAVFLQDDWKGSLHTVFPGLDVLHEAEADRRIAVIGLVRHDGLSPEEVYRKVVETARARADLVDLVGPAAQYGRPFSSGAGPQVVCLDTVDEAGAFLRAGTRAGDLVLVKSKNIFHLERAVLAQTATIGCRRAHCAKVIHCEACRLLRPSPLS